MVSWSKMTKHKKNGGLGIRLARHQNVALLGKIVWDMLHAEDKLWVQLLKALYVGGGSVFGTMSKRGSST